MFKIRDCVSQEWLHHVPHRAGDPIIAGDHTVSKGTGKVFKRRSDVSGHISYNSKFYGRHPKRFEVVEFHLVEADTHKVEVFLAAKGDREKARKAQELAAEVTAKKARIEQLQQELAKLQGE